MSKIEWTQKTYNPLSGCDKISPGCANCYAETMANRLKLMGQPNYRNGFALTLHPHMLDLPRKWKSPRTIFVNSMSDLFHAGVPLEYIQRVFLVMRETSQHTYQVLTKRADRLAELGPEIDWPANVWVGVSVENRRFTERIDHLRTVPAAVRFLSLEPLLGAMPDLNLEGIHWVIVGGESGAGARPMEEDWVRDIKAQCDRAGVAFFFKQWGGTNKKRAGRLLDGRTWDAMPERVLA